MRVMFFGKLAERIERQVEIALPGEAATVADVRALLAERFPQAREELLKPSLRACIGDEMVDDAAPVRDAEAVEFFPPLSGG